MGKMSDPRHVSSLIGDIYDTVCDSSLWIGVLGRAAHFVGAQAGALLWRNAVSRSIDGIHSFGIESPYAQSYAERYAKLDPTTTPMFLREVGEVVSTTDLLRYNEFRESRFYKEWAEPQGLVDQVQANIDKSATSVVQLSFWRNSASGMVDEAARERMRLIVPHLRRAVLVGNLIDYRTAEAATFGDALDGIGAGLFFVDASGRIVHANASGHAMLAEGTLLHVNDGRLAPNDVDAEQGLYEILNVGGRADAPADAPMDARAGAVPLIASDGEHYVAHVLPLAAGARRQAGAVYAAVAAVFVHKATLDMPPPQEAIAKLYKLTPTELRVLFAIVQVGGAPEVAEAMGISHGTVKTHLRRLFAKTGTDRQAELVKLVASYVNPLVA
jgi:DNA-binding CsgD family transcriptional regulator